MQYLNFPLIQCGTFLIHILCDLKVNTDKYTRDTNTYIIQI